MSTMVVSSMDGVMSRQLPRSCVGVSDHHQTPLPGDSVVVSYNEMHSITETIPTGIP